MGVQRVSTGAQRPIGRSTSAAARPPVGLLQLQRAAGNAAVAGLIAARQVVTAPTAPTRPTSAWATSTSRSASPSRS